MYRPAHVADLMVGGLALVDNRQHEEIKLVRLQHKGGKPRWAWVGQARSYLVQPDHVRAVNHAQLF